MISFSIYLHKCALGHALYSTINWGKKERKHDAEIYSNTPAHLFQTAAYSYSKFFFFSIFITSINHFAQKEKNLSSI